jgi:hypothetical protein
VLYNMFVLISKKEDNFFHLGEAGILFLTMSVDRMREEFEKLLEFQNTFLLRDIW